MELIQGMMKKIHNRYHFPPKAVWEGKKIEEALEEPFLKLSRLQGIQWLPHISRAIRVVTRKCAILYAYFDHVSQASTGTAEVVDRATYLANKLQDFKVLRFMHFLQDLLEILSRLSLALQKADVTVVTFLDTLETTNLEMIFLGM